MKSKCATCDSQIEFSTLDFSSIIPCPRACSACNTLNTLRPRAFGLYGLGIFSLIFVHAYLSAPLLDGAIGKENGNIVTILLIPFFLYLVGAAVSKTQIFEAPAQRLGVQHRPIWRQVLIFGLLPMLAIAIILSLVAKFVR
jgi:hypothetical protein